jgi:hypothetical protein
MCCIVREGVFFNEEDACSTDSTLQYRGRIIEITMATGETEKMTAEQIAIEKKREKQDNDNKT